MQGDEMKVCPHCQAVLEEKPGWDGALKMPQLPADNQPPALIGRPEYVGNARMLTY
jgi:hypothetical protein